MLEGNQALEAENFEQVAHLVADQHLGDLLLTAAVGGRHLLDPGPNAIWLALCGWSGSPGLGSLVDLPSPDGRAGNSDRSGVSHSLPPVAIGRFLMDGQLDKGGFANRVRRHTGGRINPRPGGNVHDGT